jgi:NADH:ubiquinone oxidoreductase subunit 6 (subunit J)
MKIKITKPQQGANFLSKFTGVLFGIFLASLIFALAIRFLDVTGVYVGLALTILLIIVGFYFTKSRTTLRMIVWGLLGTLIIGTILYIILYISFLNLLEGF